jgi:hypothetical protein
MMRFCGLSAGVSEKFGTLPQNTVVQRVLNKDCEFLRWKMNRTQAYAREWQRAASSRHYLGSAGQGWLPDHRDRFDEKRAVQDDDFLPPEHKQLLIDAANVRLNKWPLSSSSGLHLRFYW